MKVNKDRFIAMQTFNDDAQKLDESKNVRIRSDRQHHGSPKGSRCLRELQKQEPLADEGSNSPSPGIQNRDLG